MDILLAHFTLAMVSDDYGHSLTDWQEQALETVIVAKEEG